MEVPAPSGYPTFLMSPPLFLETSEPNNALMQEKEEQGDIEVDHGRAFRQFLDLYNFLAADNLVYLLPAVPGLQDETYVSNLAVVIGDTVIVSKFKSPPRKGEAVLGIEYFENLLMPTEQCPYLFEGEADLKPLTETVWLGGYGQRTERKALDWFADRFKGMTIYPIRLTDERCYHMDCVVCPLTSDHLLLAVDLIDPKELVALERIANIIPVSRELAYAGMTNCLRVGRLLTCDSSAPSLPANSEQYAAERQKEILLEGICATLGLELVLFDMSEFEKSGAALSCQVMHLNRPDVRPERNW